MSTRNYYEILGLHPNADHLMVVNAYWHLARKYKAAMTLDLRARKKLEELNEAFAIIGSPDDRAEYDLALVEHMPQSRKLLGRLRREESGINRISIEVSYWRLPAWQGMMAATATLAIAALALMAGASVIITLILGLFAVAAALMPSTTEDWKAPGKPVLWSEEEREQNAHDLERSKSAIVSRWREDAAVSESPRSLANFWDYKEAQSPSEPD